MEIKILLNFGETSRRSTFWLNYQQLYDLQVKSFNVILLKTECSQKVALKNFERR